MTKWFNIAGPCKADIHYMLSPLDRLPALRTLIDQQNYFVIHAPRQVGKTTTMLTLAQELTVSGDYTAVLLSLEVGASFPHDPKQAEQAILSVWRRALRFWLPTDLQPTEWPPRDSSAQISTFLGDWAATAERPVVIFLDEIDALNDEILIFVLRQLRDGFPHRPQGFPHSLGLIGMRDVRDYKVQSRESGRLNTSSPFNIKVESLTLSNFTFEEVKSLYHQHTEATGQIFTAKALERAFYLTQGQPWLVNALARQATQFLVTDVDQAITLEIVEQAKEILIQRQDTHLDSLAERLNEPRVQLIIEPMLSGQELPNPPWDDIQYLLDLGLCTQTQRGLEIANPIYREVLPRCLSASTTVGLGYVQPTWLSETGELLPAALLTAFLEFWRQHGQPLLQNFAYHEIAPHLVLMAFLHRVVNGGGTLEREYAIGSGRMDICLRYGDMTLAMELKVWREGKQDPLTKGLDQLDQYLAGLGLETGWLVIFDRRSGLPPLEERTTTEMAISPVGRSIVVIRG
ncbi:MAG: AAA-like domain-containing protein [Prochlorothrix sp.]|nr:AAA-like domain-containing protein [Prochlorothrix sp.]